MTVSVMLFGGSGFVGAHLAEELVRRGATVHVADVVAPSFPGVTAHLVDVRDVIPPNLPSVTVAYNLAAVHRTPGHADNEYYDTNVAGALNITRWCVDRGIRDLVFTSSISVYGPSEDPKDENSSLAPTSAYGRSKRLAEEIHTAWQTSDASRRLVIARPAVVFGAGENGNFTRLARALRSRRFLYPGRDDTVKACIYVKDLVDTLLFAQSLEQRSFLYNACYPHEYTIGEICQTFHEVAGYRLPRMLPASALTIALAGLSALPGRDPGRALHPDRVRKLTASTRIVPAALNEHGYSWTHDLREAIADWAKDDFA